LSEVSVFKRENNIIAQHLKLTRSMFYKLSSRCLTPIDVEAGESA